MMFNSSDYHWLTGTWLLNLIRKMDTENAWMPKTLNVVINISDFSITNWKTLVCLGGGVPLFRLYDNPHLQRKQVHINHQLTFSTDLIKHFFCTLCLLYHRIHFWISVSKVLLFYLQKQLFVQLIKTAYFCGYEAVSSFTWSCIIIPQIYLLRTKVKPGIH